MFQRFRPTRAAQADALSSEVLDVLGPLYATALRLTRNRPDAEDLVQDTFLKALRFAHQFKRGTNVKAWVFTILYNTWRNTRRDAARHPVDVDSDRLERAASRPGGPLVVDVTPEDLLLRSTLSAELEEALDALPEVFRQAVWLRDVEEFSYAEVADILGVPLGTVMSRLSRGRRLLFDHLTAAASASSAAAAASGSANTGAEVGTSRPRTPNRGGAV